MGRQEKIYTVDIKETNHYTMFTLATTKVEAVARIKAQLEQDGTDSRFLTDWDMTFKVSDIDRINYEVESGSPK